MEALGQIPVRHVQTEARSGALNMALDAVAADRASRDGIATVRVYEWAPSTLSLGYAQDSDTIDWSFCERKGIEVTRRPTGGGAIYHDAIGDISYSIVAPREVLPGDLMESYAELCTPIMQAFSRMGVKVAFTEMEREGVHRPACYLRALNPSHDLVVPGPPDRKISGNAQYRRRSAVVQHGSLTYRLTPERHLGCFSDDTLRESTFRDHVTSIDAHVDIDREAAIGTIETALREWSGAEPGEWADWEHDRARELVERKFGADSWVKERVDPLADAET